MPSNNKNNVPKGINAQQLNFILAICAILISAASFYATYLQADSAEKQVKAMTLPLIQFTSGNWDADNKKQQITLSLKNAGIGPAIIKNVSYQYKNKKYHKLNDFYQACCDPEFSQYFDQLQKINVEDSVRNNDAYVTSHLTNTILPGQESKNFITFSRGKIGAKFWDKLDKERFKLNMSICYCSMLDKCFITEKTGVIEPVAQCPTIISKKAQSGSN